MIVGKKAALSVIGRTLTKCTVLFTPEPNRDRDQGTTLGSSHKPLTDPHIKVMWTSTGSASNVGLPDCLIAHGYEASRVGCDRTVIKWLTQLHC